MATVCPYCNIEVSESAIESEDGCCPECGAMLAAPGSLLNDDDMYGDDEELDVFDEFDDDDVDNAFSRRDLDDDDLGGELDDAFDDDFDDFDDLDDLDGEDDEDDENVKF